jgi:myo-inositol 2-dehydrogenase/D-chiro-inositol 1-dehydrogenase
VIKFCLVGAGRIGAIHAGNIARHPGATLSHVVDANAAAAERLARAHGAATGGEDAIGAADAVLIASSTDTHAALIEKAAAAKKPIFCEKPIHLQMTRAKAAVAAAERAGVPLLIGFNRRFDPNFARLEARLRAGEIGALETLQIISRDPGPPPIDYVRVSGGLFRDMMIHDLDMARFLLRQEPIEIYAAASNLVDPAIGEAGDIDTAAVTLRTKSGVICTIHNNRRAAYGYDQRIEAFGAKGMLSAGNVAESTVVHAGAGGVAAEKPLHFFLERYARAYERELDHFIAVVEGKATLLVDGTDGLRALALADAAQRSRETGQVVKLG